MHSLATTGVFMNKWMGGPVASRQSFSCESNVVVDAACLHGASSIHSYRLCVSVFVCFCVCASCMRKLREIYRAKAPSGGDATWCRVPNRGSICAVMIPRYQVKIKTAESECETSLWDCERGTENSWNVQVLQFFFSALVHLPRLQLRLSLRKLPLKSNFRSGRSVLL